MNKLIFMVKPLDGEIISEFKVRIKSIILADSS